MASNSLTNVPEQSHEAMQAAAMRPVNGPGATPAQAAGGGLDVPGGEKSGADLPFVGIDQSRTHEPIPGERDPATLTYREPGAMSAPFNGVDLPDSHLESSMAPQTICDRVLEGGGGEVECRVEKRGER